MKDKFNINSIAILLIGLLVVSGGIYGGYQLLKKETFPQSNSVNTNSTTQSSTQNLEDGWIKYENNEYGLSFDIPDFWTTSMIEENIYEPYSINTRLYIEKNCQDKVEIVTVNNMKNYDFTKIPNDCSYMKFGILKDAPYMGTSLQNWFTEIDKEEYIGSGTIIKSEKISLAGKQAWKVELSFESNYYMIYIPNFDKNYIFSVFIIPSEGINQDMTQRILNSITFH